MHNPLLYFFALIAAKCPLLRRIAPAVLALSLIPLQTFGQGNDNPTGVAGMFNGNSSTGCSYDPYTANATRTIPDLTVAGAVGAYPLRWARTMNSRAAGGGIFGQGGGWSHSYRWAIGNSDIYQTTTPPPPSSYTVTFPDGQTEAFTAAGSSCTAAAGITERFLPLNLNTLLAYLVLPDGGQIEFKATVHRYQDDYTGQLLWYLYYSYQAQAIIDPIGLRTTLTYDTSSRLMQVTEPAGRYLKVSYGTNGYVSEVDAYTAAAHLSQWVKYTYATQTFGTVNYVVLTGANYIYGPTEQPPVATYTYQQSNNSAIGYPLILTCRDVRYPGPMKNIKYGFLAFNASYGELSQEQNVNGTMVTQLTVFGNERTEMRGDGTNAVRNGTPARTWTYGATLGPNGAMKNYLLKSYTDFQGNTTTLSYDVNGHVSSVQNARGYTTSYSRMAATGAITKITHAGDGSHIDYTYEDPTTGYYLKSATDERGKTTNYIHSPDMTTQEIDYPDGGIEKFTYNALGQVLTHTMPSNTAIQGASTDSEKYSYDATGLLLTYTPPATASDLTPSAHPTKYHYDVNDHVDTITDPRGNVTTLYHNEIGQLTIEQHDDADNSQVGYAYNTDGTLAYKNVQLNGTDWAKTDYTYDDYKRVLTVTDPVGIETDYWYDTAGLGGGDLSHTDSSVTRVVSPSGHAIRTLYDEDLRRRTVIAGAGTGDAAETDYTYDEVGNLKTMTVPPPQGQTNRPQWSYTYDARDRLVAMDDPLGDGAPSHTLSYAYDGVGNKTQEIRANGQTITYDSYDNMNRLLQTTVPQTATLNAVTTYAWANNGKLLSMLDPNLHTYSYAYDRLNRLATVTYPLIDGDHPTEGYTYDIAGNLLTFQNRKGETQTFTYDSRNRETKYTWSSGSPSPRTLTYDDASRMASCNTTNTFINFTYYADGQCIPRKNGRAI
ncbi:MAG TPA: hypothetical protein VGI60_03055 [Chthoniobacterales bacterium]|jgi:YD repeat-containing protein